MATWVRRALVGWLVLGLSSFLALSILGGASAPATGAAAPGVVLTEALGGFTEPVFITHAGDGSNRLFVVERSHVESDGVRRGGMIQVVVDGQVQPTPFLDLSSQVTAAFLEQGLLGLAFHPDYPTNRSFYVYYTAASDGANTLARFQVSADPNQADPASKHVLFSVPDTHPAHNAGMLAFGPDGYLYVAMGDGGTVGDPEGDAQNLDTLLGKILRIDVDRRSPYAIPPDNPFVSTPGARPEIWAYGLRNPWRFSFDRLTGDLYIGDVGQFQWEEINYQRAVDGGGQNYGWNILEGNHCFQVDPCDRAGKTPPIAVYYHEYISSGNCSVTGGYVYRGAAVPALSGAYLYGDFCSGRIWTLRRGAGDAWTSTLLLDTAIFISSFGEDQAGELYVTDFSTGRIYRFTDSNGGTTTPTPTVTPTRYQVWLPAILRQAATGW